MAHGDLLMIHICRFSQRVNVIHCSSSYPNLRFCGVLTFDFVRHMIGFATHLVNIIHAISYSSVSWHISSSRPFINND